MLGDLHVHTSHSDGSYSVREALAEAARRGLSYISFTDHDTLEQNKEATALAGAFGIEYIPGIEVSCKNTETGRKVHILGYYCGDDGAGLNSMIAGLRGKRDAFTRKSIRALASLGWPVSEEEVSESAGRPEVLYKQHVMALLAKKGLAQGIYGPEYEHLYGREGLVRGDIEYADPFEALGLIREAGGLPVLAHPGQYDSWDLIDPLIRAGLAGIEFYHESHSLADHERIADIARRNPSLVLTGGSDDHGSLGSLHPMGDIRAPFACLEHLLKVRTELGKYVF